MLTPVVVAEVVVVVLLFPSLDVTTVTAPAGIDAVM